MLVTVLKMVRQRAGILLGVALCGALSASAALLFASRGSRSLVPLAFVAVIVVLAMRYGAAVGLWGSLAAAGIFALFLFEPVHKLAVQNPAEKANIGWMLLAGVSLSYLLAGPRRRPYKK